MNGRCPRPPTPRPAPQSFADALIDIIEDVRDSEDVERDDVAKVLETANKVGCHTRIIWDGRARAAVQSRGGFRSAVRLQGSLGWRGRLLVCSTARSSAQQLLPLRRGAGLAWHCWCASFSPPACIAACLTFRCTWLPTRRR